MVIKQFIVHVLEVYCLMLERRCLIFGSCSDHCATACPVLATASGQEAPSASSSLGAAGKFRSIYSLFLRAAMLRQWYELDAIPQRGLFLEYLQMVIQVCETASFLA